MRSSLRATNQHAAQLPVHAHGTHRRAQHRTPRTSRRTAAGAAAARRLAFAILIAGPLIVSLAVVSAQGEQNGPLTLIAVDKDLQIRPEREGELSWTLVSSDPNTAYTIVVDAQGPAQHNWNIRLAPNEFNMPAGEDATLRIIVTPDARPVPRTLSLSISLAAINETGAVTRLSTTATAQAVGTDLILGTWDNPLPAPLNNMWGAFLGNAVAWFVISILAMWAIDPTLNTMTKWTKTDVDDHLIKILRKPLFFVLFTFGIKQSLEVFPLPLWAFRFLDRTYALVLVVAIVYVSYRVWQEIVLIIGRRFAAKTESELDDRLLPVLEKMGGILIVVAGIFYVIDSFGVDLTLFAAGGVLVSMVVAFAAQDTLSNFFSGLHLLIDQPFKEGDDIILDSGEVTTVSKIGLRTTHLYHAANHETIIVPNNLLATNRIINLLQPDNKYKVRVNVGVAYGTDVQLVKRILLEIADAHPLSLDDVDHRPFARFQNFGDSSLDFSVHIWIGDVYSRWAVASDIREAIDAKFAEYGIEIPFPQRVLWQGREEADRAAQAKPVGATIGQGPTVHRTAEAARREQDADGED